MKRPSRRDVAVTLVAPARWATVLIAAGALGACGGKESGKPAAPGPAVVTVETVRAQNVPNAIALPGRVEPVRVSEVRARVNGIVLRRLYREGSDVVAGQVLFTIDPREYQAQVGQAEAALRRADAARANAAAVVARYAPLVSDRSVSGQENDKAISDLRQADAQVAEARAALAEKRLQLSYTVVRAPISGRVGEAQVTEGALVSGNEATLMARIDQASPIYAVFTQSSSAILDMVEKYRAGQIAIGSAAEVRVLLTQENGRPYPIEGKLDFTSPTVDPQTGSQTIRAIFANPQRLLQPGQFVTARVEAGMLRGGITVPARAVQFKDAQASVMTVNAQGVAVARKVELGDEIGKRWIVTAGLKPGERIIVNGWQKARPGQPVTIEGQPAAAGKPPAGR